MNIGLTGGGFTVLFYGVSIIMMFVIELFLFAKRRTVTAELRLAFKQMFFLLSGGGTLIVFYTLLREFLHAHVVMPAVEHLSPIEQIAHLFMMYSIPIVVATIAVVWGCMALVAYIKKLRLGNKAKKIYA